MITKEQALRYIKELAENKILTKEELNNAYDSASTHKINLPNKFGISEILYYIGGGIVFLGISILLLQNWTTLNSNTKILATLGSGIATYFVGLLLSSNEKTEAISTAFYLISALVIPIGLYITFDIAGLDANSHGMQSIIFGILLLVYLLTYLVFRKTIFVFFTIIAATWLFFNYTSFLVGGNPYFDINNFFEYRLLIIGISYILIGYALSNNQHKALSGFLYNFGLLGFLGTALALGGWTPSQNIFWELIFPGLVFGALFLSVYLKSKGFLVWGTLFLMAYIFKITAEYFSSGLGWPLALVLAGLAMIAVGYLSLSISRRYL